MPARDFSAVKTLVVKVGSATLGDPTGGLHLPTLYALARQLAEVVSGGRRVILVSSGAILAGRSVLGLGQRPKLLPEKQACAAVGQIELMARWREALSVYGTTCGQVLMTAEDLTHRPRFLNARNTLLRLLELGCLPIVNENDTVATAEIRVGDNDQLASLMLNLVEADLLILLSDVAGLFSANPRQDPEARLVARVEGIAQLPVLPDQDGTVGTGGMGTKLEAARRALLAGTPAIIAAGRERDVLPRILSGESLGTLFVPKGRTLTRRKQWLAFAKKPLGVLHVDAGAVVALRERGRSLLPAGITRVDGAFEAGSLVLIVGPEGHEVARGLTNLSAGELGLVQGRRSSSREPVPGMRHFEEVVHRDNLVLRDLESDGRDVEEGERP